MAAKIPVCPITQEPLRDPVMDPDGNTYEKAAILAWLVKDKSSPLTRKPLTAEQLIPNRALLELIQEYDAGKQGKGEPGEGAPPQKQADAKEEQQPEKEAEKEKEGDGKEAEGVEVEAVVLGQQQQEQTVLTSWQEDDLTGFVIDCPDRDDRSVQPAHVCCVVDVSGSMSDPASIKNEKGVTENDGLTLLDIVRHATNTIIEGLAPSDTFSLVSFSNSATTLLSAVAMDEGGKRRARRALEELEANGGTNLAAGVKQGIEAASATGNKFFTSVLVLTDGVPNDRSLDYSGFVRRQLDQKPLFGSMHTFGFGYQLDSQLLQDIARAGDGTFSFIPDAGFVGTIFINAMANLRCVYGVNPKLVLADPEPVQSSSTSTSECAPLGQLRQRGHEIDLPPLRFGSRYTCVVRGLVKPRHAKIVYQDLNGQVLLPYAGPVAGVSLAERQYHIARLTASTNLFAVAKRVGTSTPLETVAKVLDVPPQVKELSKDVPAFAALVQDLDGEVKLSIAKEEEFQRWGRHFLVSLAFAHLHQNCNNFKDPGVQHYGGALFKQVQGRLNDAFVALPAPKPTGLRFDKDGNIIGGGGHGGWGGGVAGARGARVAAAPHIDMSRYNNYGGGCMHPDTPVLMADGSEKPISQLRKGDKVVSSSATSSSSPATVRCVVRFYVASGSLEYVRLGKKGRLLITPYHPVAVGEGKEEWKFPANLATPVEVAGDATFNLVLDAEHCSVVMDGVSAVTLGHGLQTNDVVAHAYFGTQAVVEDLAAQAGWEVGHVELRADGFARDGITGRVTGLAA